jgi:hypothetical protein
MEIDVAESRDLVIQAWRVAVTVISSSPAAVESAADSAAPATALEKEHSANPSACANTAFEERSPALFVACFAASPGRSIFFN